MRGMLSLLGPLKSARTFLPPLGKASPGSAGEVEMTHDCTTPANLGAAHLAVIYSKNCQHCANGFPTFLEKYLNYQQ